MFLMDATNPNVIRGLICVYFDLLTNVCFTVALFTCSANLKKSTVKREVQYKYFDEGSIEQTARSGVEWKHSAVRYQ